MKKPIRKIFIIFLIMIVFVAGKYFIANRMDILLNYNEKDYEYTDFLVEIGNKNYLSAYYRIDDDYYKNNKSKPKEWIEEDVKIKNFENKYCEPQIEILKSIKNLETTSAPTSTTPDLSMSFTIQKDKMLDKESWNYYDGEISIYLKDNIISLNKFGIESNKYYISKKVKYYTLDDKVKGNINKIVDTFSKLN